MNYIRGMEHPNIEKIISEFELFCIKNDIAAKDLNTNLANKYAKRIINCYLQLKELGRVSDLGKLLKSENENVRLWAATHTLQINTLESKEVLKTLAAKPGPNALSAEMTLREWERGNLKLEYETYKVKW